MRVFLRSLCAVRRSRLECDILGAEVDRRHSQMELALKQLETETGVPVRDRWNSNAQAAKRVFDEQFPPDMSLPDNANADVPAWQGMDGQGVSRSVPL